MWGMFSSHFFDLCILYFSLSLSLLDFDISLFSFLIFLSVSLCFGERGEEFKETNTLQKRSEKRQTQVSPPVLLLIASISFDVIIQKKILSRFPSLSLSLSLCIPYFLFILTVLFLTYTRQSHRLAC